MKVKLYRQAAKATRNASERVKRWAKQYDYDNEHYMTLSTRVERQTAYRFRKYCANMGTTPYEVIKMLVVYWMVAAEMETGTPDNIDSAMRKVFAPEVGKKDFRID